MTKHYGFVMLVYRCIDCKACQVACWAENAVPLGKSRNWITKDGYNGTFPNLNVDYLPGNCMHCANAPCVSVCPTGASYKREDGLVLVNNKKWLLVPTMQDSFILKRKWLINAPCAVTV